jgi:hypothetical protein
MLIRRLLFLVSLLSLEVMSQDIAIGQWRDHLSYTRGGSVATDGRIVYCAAEGNLFKYDEQSGEIERQNKIQGYSDVGVARLAWHAASSTLLVAYSNTNIDLLRDNKIYNIPDIKNKQFPGNKTINRIFLEGDFAYLCCGFGIVKLNIIKKEISETWFLGPNSDLSVQALTADADRYYAATQKGIYTASKSNSFLSDPSQWQRDTARGLSNYNALGLLGGYLYANEVVGSNNGKIHRLNISTGLWEIRQPAVDYKCYDIRSYNGNIYFVFGGSVEVWDANGAIVDAKYGYGGGSSSPREIDFGKNNDLWIADDLFGLVKAALNINFYNFIKPEGPSTNSVYDLSVNQGILYVAPGDQDQWGKQYNKDGISIFKDNKWTVVDGINLIQLYGATDVLQVLPDPKDTGRFFAAAWGHGVIGFRNQRPESFFNNRNSGLDSIPGYNFTGVAGMTFDKDGNLWCTNSLVQNGIVVYDNKSKGWTSFFTKTLTGNNRISRIIATQGGQKWMIMPDAGGLLAFTESGTISNTADDKIRKIGFGKGSGGLPGTDVFCIAEDLEGEIWVGTNEGVAVFFSPSTVFDETNWEAQQILIEQGGYVENLLENEIINCILVDGANRKWIGTANSGAYLISADGTRELLHFNTDNSPILSNTIKTIAINGETGEVFFGTNKGIISYKNTATEPDSEFSNVVVYPNPVRRDYSGTIAIKGLVKNCDVRITDIAGNVIYTTQSLGGQAIWDGNNFEGRKASTGVYLIYCTNPDGSQRYVSKILIGN